MCSLVWDSVCLGVDNFDKQVMIYKKWFSDVGADCKLIDGDKVAEFFCGRGDLAGRICTCTILHNCIFKILHKFDTPQDTSIFLKFASEFSPTICKPNKFHAKIFRQREREGVGLNGSNSEN